MLSPLSRGLNLLTGKNHLLKLRQFGNTRIVKPVDFLEIQTHAGSERWFFLRDRYEFRVESQCSKICNRARGCYTK
jgi:hypothetical protein